MHPRNFGSHVTVYRPAPQENQCKKAFFTLCGNLQPVFNLMKDIHAEGGGRMNSSVAPKDCVGDEAGHPDVSCASTYPGKFGKFYWEIRKKLTKYGYQLCISSPKFATFSRKQHFHCNERSIS